MQLAGFPTIMEKKHVLIVGEDDLIAWAIRKRFSAMQVPVRIVRTPEEALADLRKGLYGLVVFDPGLLVGGNPALPGGFRRLFDAAGSSLVPGGDRAGNGEDADPLAEIRFVEKPLNIFDLDRVVERMTGRYSEKRGDPRYTCNIPVSIFLREEDRGEGSSAWGHPTGVAADASEDGLRVFTSHHLAPGQQLRLSPLSVHNPQARFIHQDRVAEVVWSVPDEEGVIAGLRYIE